MKSIELFSGAGGLALGIHLAGFVHQLLVEVDDDASETLLYNSKIESVPGISSWSIIHDRVESLDLNNYGEIDLLAAGIPCQPFSNGGKRGGVEDDRNMFPVFARAVATVKPKAFLLENVNGLIHGKLASHMEYIIKQLTHPWHTASGGSNWHDHFGELSLMSPHETDQETDYRVYSKVVNAADYGVPQIRKRVFIVGFRKDLAIRWNFPATTHSKEVLLADALSNTSSCERHEKIIEKAMKSNTKKEMQNMATTDKKAWVLVDDVIRDLPEMGTINATKMQHVLIPGAKSYKGHTGSMQYWPAKPLKAGTHGVGGGENMLCYDGGKVRYFSIRECARLQTFPDSWTFKGTWSSITKQLGNAVPVKMAAVVAKSIRIALEASAKSAKTN